MEKFEVNILGCGSALPTTRHLLSSQVVNLRGKLFMIDCGEAAQLQYRTMKLSFSRLNHIFISHLHGDHCFGLFGLISTLGMLGRRDDLHIFAQPDGEKVFRPMLDYFCTDLPYQVVFHAFDPQKNALIFEDRTLKVLTIPLKHRVPTAGFLFEEKEKNLHIVPEMIDFYQIPFCQINALKAGADFVTPDGQTIPNERLTHPATPPKRYAYCSDTLYNEKIIPIIEGVDVLYHESTFCESRAERTKQTMHSTARQAAEIARAANVKKLILGHFSARIKDENVLLTEACEIFPNSVLASEGLVVEI